MSVLYKSAKKRKPTVKFVPKYQQDVLYEGQVATFFWKNDGTNTCRIHLNNCQLTVKFSKIKPVPERVTRTHDRRVMNIPIREMNMSIMRN